MRCRARSSSLPPVPQSTILAQKDTKDFKLLGVSGDYRLPEFPDVPTLKEQGLKDVEMDSWYGLSVPKGTPQEVIDRLDQAVADLAKDETFVARAAASGIPILHLGPKEFAEKVEKDTAICTDVIKSAGIVVQ